MCESENGCGFFRDSVSPSPAKSTCNVQQSKWRRWNDNCTGRTGSHGEASPLEPAASSEQAAAKAGQMATKRKREPLELSPAEAERRSKKAEAARRRREEIKNAGGPVLYRALREEIKKRKLSQLGAEEAAKVLKKKAYSKQHYAEAKTAGGKAEAAALREASKRKLSQLSAEEAAKVLKQKAYNEQYYAEAKTAGGKARFAERRAARIARKAAREARKERKARAKARARRGVAPSTLLTWLQRCKQHFNCQAWCLRACSLWPAARDECKNGRNSWATMAKLRRRNARGLPPGTWRGT